MQTKFIKSVMIKIVLSIILFSALFSCKKDLSKQDKSPQVTSNAVSSIASANSATPPFNLEAILRGEGKGFGHVKFRQDNDADKIVTLGIWVRDLKPNHQYLLQRAVDANIDGNCTSTAWLTLGKGLVPQSILTDDNGTGREELFRNLSAFPTGATFDIHFRVVDAMSLAVALTSDCYQFTVR